MKHQNNSSYSSIALTFLMLISLSFLLIDARIFASERIPLPVEKIYIQDHIKSMDQMEIVIGGYLANSCYATPESEVSVNQEERKVNVTLFTSLASRSPYCLFMIRPFLHGVKVGRLIEGDYKLVVNGEDENGLAYNSEFKVVAADHP